MPPITSITIFISGSLTMECKSVVTIAASIPSRGALLRTPTLFKTSKAPERSESSCRSDCSRRATWLPTTPAPSIPIEIVFNAASMRVILSQMPVTALNIQSQQICLALTAHNHAGFSILNCNNWWAQNMIVVTGHAATICTSCRDGQ